MNTCIIALYWQKSKHFKVLESPVIYVDFQN